MPVISSNYNPPHLFKNGHFSTIYSSLMRKVNGVLQERERITLPDGDFLDLDWSFSTKTTNKLVIVLHGLEGNAQRPYMAGTAKVFNKNNFDAVCINFRSCSGETNSLYKSYHSGATEDLEAVIEYIVSDKKYDTIILTGFSLGGNVTLKYLGERDTVPKQIKAAIAVSVPCFLYGSMLELHKTKNVLYAKNFKKHLLEKLKWKQKYFPELITDEDLKKIITLKDFDDFYTSKAHGFTDAVDYYSKSSSLQFLKNIQIPTLIINAKNDSFLSQECYPEKEAERNKNLFLEIPAYGGHVGFYEKNNIYYNETQSVKFVSEHV
ncbi:YheT family hydrolase [Abyssalbus ytuae]|uniref:Alpha/beta fold hydrolase n=1 Tax=Abyssalbus ytuae TaxID=2926907 RepID=A0A9E6ZRI1_9FLAO|nr:alpha/beta fold hydrolase [Abyssalbus ytuae]UOB19160.1 alpha/beta fold hydrolase [Abyssalbus ytuae]